MDQKVESTKGSKMILYQSDGSDTYRVGHKYLNTEATASYVLVSQKI